MPPPTETQIHDAIVEALTTAVAPARVHNAIKIPTNDGEYAEICVDENGKGNVWFCLWAGSTDELTDETDDPVAVIHRYMLAHWRAYELSADESDTPSGILFKDDCQTARSAFHPDTTARQTLGLGNALRHRGLQYPSTPPVTFALGSYEGHWIEGQIIVVVGDC